MQQYSPEWASKITGVPVEDIVTLATEYATTAAGGDPHRGRRRAARRRRPDRPLDRLPAGPRRRLAPRRRRIAAASVVGVPDQLGPVCTRPDLIRPGTRVVNQFQLGPGADRRARPRPADQGPVRLQQQPGHPGLAPGPDAAGAGPRRPVHRGQRAVPHRHRRLRRHRPAGDDAARAVRPDVLVGPPLPELEPAGDRAARRGGAERRAVPPAVGDGWVWTSTGTASATRRWRRRRSTGRTRTSPGSPSTCSRRRDGPGSTCPVPTSTARTPRATSRRRRARCELRSSLAEQVGSIVLPVFREGSNEFQVRRRGRPVAPLRRSPRGRTRRLPYPLFFLSPKAHAFLNSQYGNATRQRRVQGDEQWVLINSRRRRAARHRRRRRGPHLQRARRAPCRGPCRHTRRRGVRRRRLPARTLGQVDAGRLNPEPGHPSPAHRSRQRPHVLRHTRRRGAFERCRLTARRHRHRRHPRDASTPPNNATERRPTARSRERRTACASTLAQRSSRAALTVALGSAIWANSASMARSWVSCRCS